MFEVLTALFGVPINYLMRKNRFNAECQSDSYFPISIRVSVFSVLLNAREQLF